MLGRVTQWLSTKLVVPMGKEDDHMRQRLDALTRVKKATLDVLQLVNERNGPGEPDLNQRDVGCDSVAIAPLPQSGPEQNGNEVVPELVDAAVTSPAAVDVPTAQLIDLDMSDMDPVKSKAKTPIDAGQRSAGPPPALTMDDLCVHELCNALAVVLKMGLKRQNDKDLSVWNVLYGATLIVDEPTLVDIIQAAAAMAQTDAGKTRCWLKIALNTRTIESSLMIIFSATCEQLIRASYEDWALVRCPEGLDLFLQMIVDLRDVNFSLQVNDEPFKRVDIHESAPIPIPGAVDAAPTKCEGESGPCSLINTPSGTPPAPNMSPAASDVTMCSDKVGGLDATTPAVAATDDIVEISAVVFSHRHKGIKPWQFVFGIGLSYLSKNPYHSQFAMIDPALSIPDIVQDCIDILYAHPDTPRLFRTTMLSMTISQLREVVETDGVVPADLDAHGAAALLLDFFRNLPESLLTTDKYEAFVASGRLKDEDASVRNITCLVQDLPVHYRVVLEKVIGVMHFLLLPEHSAQNGLDIALASSMLAPVIAFKSETLTTPEGRRKMSHTQNHDVRFAAVGAQVVERMILHYDIIFQRIRLQVSEALEKLEAKKAALLTIYQLYKMKPQVKFLGDRTHLEEISAVFLLNARAKELKPPGDTNILDGTMSPPLAPPAPPSSPIAFECGPPLKHHASSPHLLADLQPRVVPPVSLYPNDRTGSGGELGVRRHVVDTPQPAAFSNVINGDTDPKVLAAWQKHGFNRPTLLGNFDKGGVLLLRSVAYTVKRDSALVDSLYQHALPTMVTSYDAGLVASAICKSLVNILKLVPIPDHPTINIVALSIEPFWDLLGEDMYFFKLFHLVFQMFDQLWSSLSADEASFTRVFCDTEARLKDLLERSPRCVEDMRLEWEETWRRITEELNIAYEQNSADAIPGSGPPSPPHMSKKPSFTILLEDFKDKLLNPSGILTLEQVAYIDHAVPITCQLCRWCLLYSTSLHGSSLHTLLMLVKSESPTLIVVQDDQGNVFGGFGSDEWHHSSHYFGNGETFLFTFAPRAGQSTVGATSGSYFTKYPWSRRNNYFMLCSEDSLVLGGGGSFGLYLDSDLSRGTTGPCETFSSRPLVATQEFNCVQVEVWGFTTNDKNMVALRQQQYKKKSVLE